ncbi:MAG: hypothetical protein EA341_16325 [Mongoliibacter sp.]|nr:MAG: hypothetical protein EA341_16325 [Mongoliibacter sp.]
MFFLIFPRRYRNRRLGDFLKELDLTEGKATGIPTIIKAMKNNGSPSPEFHTDEDRSFFHVVLPIHDAFLAPTKVRRKTDTSSEKTAKSSERSSEKNETKVNFRLFYPRHQIKGKYYPRLTS